MSSLPASLQLYRNIRRLHRNLPPELGRLGNDYVKSEFRRHKECEPIQLATFLKEWSFYEKLISKQVQEMLEINTSDKIPFGRKLKSNQLNSLNDGQVGQLFALKEAITTGDVNGVENSDDINNEEGRHIHHQQNHKDKH